MNKIYNVKIQEINTNVLNESVLLCFSIDCIGPKILDTYLILDLNMKEEPIKLYNYLMEDKKYEYASCDLPKSFRVTVCEIDDENHIPIYCDMITLNEDYDILKMKTHGGN